MFQKLHCINMLLSYYWNSYKYNNLIAVNTKDKKLEYYEINYKKC